MTIGTSDGRQFSNELDYLLKQGQGDDNSQGPIISNYDPSQVNRQHHVPLVASAIMDDKGAMSGMAVDHRLDPSNDDLELLHLHESTELPWMQDYIKAGMSYEDAYHKAHDYATARETAASIAKWGEEGHEAYQARMRAAASIAAEPTDRERHPDAHTTRYGLDESEGRFQVAQQQVAGYQTPQERMADYQEEVKKEGQAGGPTKALEHKPFHPLSILGAPPVMSAGQSPSGLPPIQQVDTGLMGNPPDAPKFFNPKPERLEDVLKTPEEAEKEAREGPEEKIEPLENRDPEDTDLDLPDESMEERLRRILGHIHLHASSTRLRIRHKKKAGE